MAKKIEIGYKTLNWSLDSCVAGPVKNPILKNLFQNGYFFSAAMRIAGGTDEVLRNIIAERVLGLPQDERPDKKLPFNELPSGKN